MQIILLGDPAAGKATQAKKLLKKYNLVDFDMGEELRKIQFGRGNAKLKKVLARTYSKGKLTPTWLVRAILKKKIFSIPKNKAILFDGHPKMIDEAKLVSKWLSQIGRPEVQVLYLSIPEKEIIKRMSKRIEYVKGKKIKRTDDNPKAMHLRIKYFRSGINEVIDFFKKKYPFKRISGLGSTAAVHQRIIKAIGKTNTTRG